MEVIIVSPLILSYKYEQLKEEKVVERFTKKSGEEREYNDSEEEVILLSLCTENDSK